MGKLGFNLDAEDRSLNLEAGGQGLKLDEGGVREVRAGLGRTGVTIDKEGVKEVSIDLVPGLPSVPGLADNPGPKAKIERLDGDRGYQTTIEAGGGQAKVSLGIGGDGIVAETKSGPTETKGVIESDGSARFSTKTQLIPGGSAEVETDVEIVDCTVTVRNQLFGHSWGYELTLPTCKKPDPPSAPGPPGTGQGSPEDQSWDAEGTLPGFRSECEYSIWFLIERNEHLYKNCTGYNVYGGCTGYGFASYEFNSRKGKLFLKAPTTLVMNGQTYYYMNTGGILGACYVCGPRSGGLACTEGADFTQNAPGGFPGVVPLGGDVLLQTPESYGVTFYDNVEGYDAAALISERVSYYKSWGQYTNIRVFIVEKYCPLPLVKRGPLLPDYSGGGTTIQLPPWNSPPIIKMKDDACCSLLRKIYEFLQIEVISTYGFKVPYRLQRTAGEGEQLCKNWEEIQSALLRVMDHLGTHPFSVSVADLRSDLEGNQGFEMDLPSATQALQVTMAKVWAEGGKADTLQRFVFQLSLLTTHLAIMNAKQLAALEAIKDAIGADFEFTQDPFRLPFNLKAGQVTTDTTRGKGFDPKKKKDIVESNGIEYDAEKLDPAKFYPEFLQAGDHNIAYEKFAGKQDVMDLLKLIIIKLEKLQNR